MAQLVFKVQVPDTDIWRVVKRLGEYDSDTIIPRVGESVVIVEGIKDIAVVYKINAIEYIYKTVFNNLVLYHVCCYVEYTTSKDSEEYVGRKKDRAKTQV